MPPSGQPSESPRLKNSKDGKGNATPKANDSAGILKPSSPQKPSPKTRKPQASPKPSPAQAGIRGSNHVESGNRDKHVSLPMSSIVLYTIAYDI